MRRAVRGWALAAAAATALAGCVALPTSGPVSVGDEDVQEHEGVVVLAQGPQPGADPGDVVEGFLLAGGTEVTGEFDVTREYLAPDERTAWDPGALTIVTTGMRVEQSGDAQVTVALDVTAKVDAEGRYVEAPAEARETLRFELVEDARGDWRISDAPDAVVVTARRFPQQFRDVEIYFLTPDRTMLVPEVRWFRNRPRNLPTAVVQALVAGPSPWLRDAVATEVPVGTQLKPEAVTVEDGVATFSLEPAKALQEEADRGLLLAQLQASLGPLAVASLEVHAGPDAVLEGEPADLPALPPERLEVLVDGQTFVLGDGTLAPVDDVGVVEGAQPHAPARAVNGSVRVALADPGTLVTVPVGSAPQTVLLTGPRLVAPSVDRYGWVWTAGAGATGELDLVRADGTTNRLRPGWLTGRDVQAVRVSRDGTRLAVVSEGPDGPTLEVSGIVRDEQGAPVTVGEGVRAGARLSPTGSVVWVDDRTLGVLSQGDSGVTPWLVPVSGSSTALPAVADAVSLAADRGQGTVYVITSDGDLLRHQGGTWAPVRDVTEVLDVTGAAFPG